MARTPQEEIMNASASQYRELDFRAADGVEIGLFWNTATDRLVVVVDDSRSGDLFELEVSADEATDAFAHPYAYAAHRGVEYAAGLRTPVYA
jgi:hypothetical protein